MGIDPSGEEFSIAGLTSSLGVSSNSRSRKQGADLSARRGVRKVINETIETFSFVEDRQPASVRLAANAERLWANRMRQLGYQFVLPLQSSPIGSHGPDLFAAKWENGRIKLAIAEVKGLTSSHVLSALDRTKDNTLQMSLRWLRRHVESLLEPSIQALSRAVGQSLSSFDVGFTKRSIEAALANGEFDLYLLRARKYESGFKLKGFKLLHVGDQNVKLGSDANDPLL